MLPSIDPNQEKSIDYAIFDNHLPFSNYIQQNRHIVEERRVDLQQSSIPASVIITANTPFEFSPKKPSDSAKIKYGVLLIHGLFDCPFSLRDIGMELKDHDILVRSILLPGHGTKPSDLISVKYEDWLQAVKYGVQTFQDEVEHLFLIGYSTGATLSIFEAMENSSIKGLILLSPAIRIKPPIDAVLFWKHLRRAFLKSHSDWITIEKEIDYAKYSSIAFNPVFQLTKLTQLISNTYQVHGLKQPMMMIVSREDETISSHHAIEFFNQIKQDKNKLLLYTSSKYITQNPQVIIRYTHDYDSIKHFSHNAIPFAPNNPHYGKNGDFIHAISVQDKIPCTYGAYNLIEVRCFDWLCKLGLIKIRRRNLRYNPDFEFMSQQIKEFIFSVL